MEWKMRFSWVKPPLIRCVGEGFDIRRQGTSYKSGHVPSMLISLLVKSLKSLRYRLLHFRLACNIRLRKADLL
jgi:hypothetical protein